MEKYCQYLSLQEIGLLPNQKASAQVEKNVGISYTNVMQSSAVIVDLRVGKTNANAKKHRRRHRQELSTPIVKSNLCRCQQNVLANVCYTDDQMRYRQFLHDDSMQTTSRYPHDADDMYLVSVFLIRRRHVFGVSISYTLMTHTWRRYFLQADDYNVA